MTEPFSFEKAYARLEKILELLNDGKADLEQSLKLYEESDQLIVSCSAKLQQAEQTIQTLIKNRNGALETNQSGEACTESFNPASSNNI
ncbi:MAG: exodeoxyribonuclease VII small subunit [Simkaniaceae bacterium]|nr:exodeoxyribonuclease VII small subunit [Simkaniaceae bacterium]